MTHASSCSDSVTYYERNKEQRRELNKMIELEYYYQNVEKEENIINNIGKMIIYRTIFKTIIKK